jgi:hypothetical protein
MNSKFKKIAFIGQPEYFKFCYETDLNELYEVREYPLMKNGSENNFSDLFKFSPDIAFIFRADFLPASFFENLNCIKIALSSEPFPRQIGKSLQYTIDSLSRYLFFRRNIRSKKIDYLFHYDEASLNYMQRDGLQLSGSFYFPVATEFYSPKYSEKKWDLFFIGRDTLHREKFFLPLKKDFNFLHIAHGVFGEDLLKYISQSSICLNVHAENEISWEPRMQMLLAAGAFVISEKITPNDILRPGVDYIEASSPDDMYKKISYYLQHTESAQKISETGRGRILSKLQATKVFRTLINDVLNGKYRNFHANNGAFWLDIIDYLFKMRRFLNFHRKIFSKR